MRETRDHSKCVNEGPDSAIKPASEKPVTLAGVTDLGLVKRRIEVDPEPIVEMQKKKFKANKRSDSCDKIVNLDITFNSNDSTHLNATITSIDLQNEYKNYVPRKKKRRFEDVVATWNKQSSRKPENLDILQKLGLAPVDIEVYPGLEERMDKKYRRPIKQLEFKVPTERCQSVATQRKLLNL